MCFLPWEHEGAHRLERMEPASCPSCAALRAELAAAKAKLERQEGHHQASREQQEREAQAAYTELETTLEGFCEDYRKQRDDARAALATAQAECAAMRAALRHMADWYVAHTDHCHMEAENALSGTAGRALAAEVEALRRVAEAARAIHRYTSDHQDCDCPGCQLDEALAALATAGKADAPPGGET